MDRNKAFASLQKLDLSSSENLMQTLDFTGMPNLEYLDLTYCINLEEVHESLGSCRKLIQLDLHRCESLKRFPYVNVESLDLQFCTCLEKFPVSVGRMKPELEIDMQFSGIRELASSIQYLTRITKLNLSCLKEIVALPSSIGMLKNLISLYAWDCSKLEIFPEEIRDLENLEILDLSYTLISRPPSYVIFLNKLRFLTFKKQKSGDGVLFVFPQVNEGFRSLEDLNLSCCNLIDGGLPEDIGCLSSLKLLNLRGNNIEHLPRSIAQLGALRSLDLKECKRLKDLPGFMGMSDLDTLNLSYCVNLEEIHHSLGFLKKLCTLKLTSCKWLKRFPHLSGVRNSHARQCDEGSKFDVYFISTFLVSEYRFLAA